jgi:ABC-type uncharacterized transport system auxiliary subunit
VKACLTPQRDLRLLDVLLMALPALILAGCSGVLESNKPAREVYLLQAPTITPLPPAGTTRAPAGDAVKLVLSVETVPGLDTDNIQVLHSNARLFPVANAHWPDNLPEVMRSLSRRVLVDSGLFQNVSLGTLARPGEWQLELELQAFYGLQDSANTTTAVLMELEGNLRCGEAGGVISLDSRIPLHSSGLPELVAAHQQALNEVLQALPGRIQQTCSP